MYEYFIGQVTVVTSGYIVLEVEHIGYKLYVANPFAFEADATAKVYIYQSISDTAHVLYGFVDLGEKQLFELLIGVTGIGPKSALAILAASNHNGLMMAIQQEDLKYLTKFPGVGKKTAQQLIIDLKDKISKINTTAGSGQGMTMETELLPPEVAENDLLKDALAALGALGFSRREIDKIQPKLLDYQAETTDAYLREGLRLLTGA